MFRLLVHGLVLFWFFGTTSIAAPPELRVSYHERSLRLFDGNGVAVKFAIECEGNCEVAESLPVAVPSFYPRYWPARGVIRKAIINPVWRPTRGTREYYCRKEGVDLPLLLSPGHELNAMGKVKIPIRFESALIYHPVMIHGTIRPEHIGMRISRGCVRLHNLHAKLLLEAIVRRKLDEEFLSAETVALELEPVTISFQ